MNGDGGGRWRRREGWGVGQGMREEGGCNRPERWMLLLLLLLLLLTT